MRKKLVLALAVCASLSVWAQGTVKGVVKIAGTSEPAVGAVVTLQGQKVSAVTDANGVFVIETTKTGDEVLTVLQEGYDVASKPIAISSLETLDLGEVVLVSKEEAVKTELTEEMFLA
ncbi:MAG TPA: carboxypeptidase-like regulatory domain-containing protein, partial [Paludibacteraceae bacterium]|nr:carboxypeptidase-like regulatory domain-containing protein [Paludibacteraceae bacterium]